MKVFLKKHTKRLVIAGAFIFLFSITFVVVTFIPKKACATICGIWTPQPGSGSFLWSDIALSENGSKMAAVTGQYNTNGGVYTSNDSGVTWTYQASAGLHKWMGIASSYDGTHLAAVAQTADIYTSTDSGLTWIDQTGSGVKKWRAIASSADGMKLVAAVNTPYDPSGAPGDIYTSSDGGVTWVDRISAGTHNWSGLASSADGQRLVAVGGQFGGNDGEVMVSSDGGVTWTDTTPAGTKRWYTVAMSANGQYVMIGGTGMQLYRSTDYGNTWTVANPTYNIWNDVAMSEDGSKIIVTPNNRIYLSTDYGANVSMDPNGNGNWKGVGMSPDGKVIVSYGFSGNVLTGVFDNTPNNPSSLGPLNKTDGSLSNSNHPSFVFDVSDPDVNDAVKYRLLISANSDYSSPIVDYTSGLSSSSTMSFYVGQNAGSGLYSVGSNDQSLPDGSYYWEVQAIDNLGAVSGFVQASSGTPAFAVDATPPVISEITPINSVVATSTPSYTFNASEVGTITYGGDCTSSQTSVASGDNTITFSQLSEGIHSNCSIKITDAAGNESNTINISNFIVDTSEPVLTEVTKISSPSSISTPSYIFSANESGNLTYSGGCTSTTTTAVPGDNRITFESLPDGIYSNCQIVLTDPVGNVSAPLNITAFEVNAIQTIISEHLPIASHINTNTPSYSFDSNETGTVSYGGDCTSSQTSAIAGTNTVTFDSLSEGLHSNCTITVYDADNNPSNVLPVTPFIVDTVLPVLTEVSPVNEFTNDKNPVYIFSSSEPGIINYGGSCSSEQTTAVSGNNEISFNSLADGMYSDCTIKVTDYAGNNSNILNLTTFTVDSDYPTLTEVIPVSSPSISHSPSYTFNTNEGGTIKYLGDCISETKDALKGDNIIVFSNLPEGQYDKCSIIVTDAAGNDSLPLSITPFVVDEKPTLTQVSAMPSRTDNHNPSYTFNSTKAGLILYFGQCSGLTNWATVGTNSIILSYLNNGSYSDCGIKIKDFYGAESDQLNFGTFTVYSPNTVVSVVSGPHAHPPLPSDQVQSKNIENNQTTNEVLKNSSKTSGMPIFIFKNTLKIGDVMDPDVAQLQRYLNTHGAKVADAGPGSFGQETSKFGYLTRQALINFQDDHAKDILLPVGLSKGTGIFGQSTMGFVNSNP